MNAIASAVRHGLRRNAGRATAVQNHERYSASRETCTRLCEEGWALACQGRQVEAEQCYRKAQAAEPSVYRRICGAQWVEAGDYEQGWALVAHGGDTRWPDVPRWNGRRVNTLVVSPSGGLGDQILFARYIEPLKARADRVVVLTPKPLTRLFRRMAEVFEIDRVPNGQVFFDFPGHAEAWIDMDALPHLLGTRMDSIPRGPYISAYPEDVERWRTKLPQDGLRVGLVWRTCATAREPHRRSLSLSTLAPLWQVPGASFVSLQKGDGEDEARSCPLPLTLVDDRDMADAAAVIANLDLVIGTDVAITNLAGSMGKPTWVLAEPYPNFRWRHGWYKNGRLFCQETNGDWSGPVQDAAQALAGTR